MTPLEEMGQFATVVVDPPWPLAPIGLKSGGLTPDNAIDYPTMTITEIAALPIADCLADDALVFCWTVNKFLPQTFDIVSGWGCRYSFVMTWLKSGGVQTPVTPCFNTDVDCRGPQG